MPRSVVFHSIEVFNDGRKTLKLRKVVIEDGDVMLNEPHIHQIEAGETIAESTARLKAALGGKWPALSAADKQKIAAIAAAG